MTANLKRFDPAGTDGNAATATGNLTSVIIGGAGAVTYEADYGMDRGSNMGLRAVAPGTADQANIKVTTTAAATGSGQVYGGFENWHSGAADQEFMTLRTAAGNCIRFVATTAGVIKVQNQAGSPVATLGSVSLLPTRYRWELEAVPGTTTSNGSGRARVYDDDDNLVYDSGPLTAGNYGGGLATKTVSELRVGDPATATTSGFAFGFTQPAIDTDASAPPTIPPVAKAVPATVSVPAATMTVTAIEPVVSAGVGALVTVSDASLVITAFAPTVSADVAASGGGPIVLTVTAPAPAVSAQRSPTVVAPAATLTVAAPAPAVSGQRAATVVAAATTVTITALAPSTQSGGTPALVQVPPASATVTAPVPVVTGQRAQTVAPAAMTMDITPGSSVITGGRIATTQVAAASLTVQALPQSVSGLRAVAATIAAALLSIIARTPTVTTMSTPAPARRKVRLDGLDRVIAGGGGTRIIKAEQRRQ